MRKRTSVIVGCIFIVIMIIGMASLGSYLRYKNNNMPAPSRAILFYRYTCPHCIKVETFLKQYSPQQLVPYEMKEIDESTSNRVALFSVAKACHLNTSELGIPLLWTGEKCIQGDKEIINYFKYRLKLKNAK